MNQAQTPTARGGQWYASTVRTILDNGAYAGVAQWDGIEQAGIYPVIVSKATYEAAHKRLQALRPGVQLESEIVRRLERVEC